MKSIPLFDSGMRGHRDPIRAFAEHVIVGGDRVESRYGSCIELLGGSLKIPCGTLAERRGINYSLGWMEMLQLIAGRFDPEALKRVAPNANHALFTFPMAYGPRIAARVRAIIDALRMDPDTRQAVLFVASPTDGPTPNLPCTTTIQFLIRKERIHAIVSMRSWDLCRGLPYDIMMFSGLLGIVGRCLNTEAGDITVQAGSAHVYTEWSDRLPETLPESWRFTDEVPTTWFDCMDWANGPVENLQRGELPKGVEYVPLRGWGWS